MGNSIPSNIPNVGENAVSNIDPHGWDGAYRTIPVATTGDITSGNIGNSPFIRLTGTHKVIQSASFPAVNASIETVGIGIYYVPTAQYNQDTTEAAHGVSSVSLKLALAASFNFVFMATVPGNFNASGQYGYTIAINASGDVILFKITNGAPAALVTVNGAVTAGVSFRLQASVYPDGYIDILIDGAVIATVVDSTYREAIYQNISAGTGDVISLGNGSQNDESAFTKSELVAVSKRIYAIGDSLTFGSGGDGTSYPGVLGDSIGSVIANIAPPGANLNSIINEQLPIALRYGNPDILVLGGTNDLGALTSAQISAKLQEIYDACTAAGLRCVSIHITPRTGGHIVKIGEVNDYIDANAPGPVVVTASLGDASYEILPQYDADGVHFNAAGYTALAALVEAAAY